MHKVEIKVENNKVIWEFEQIGVNAKNINVRAIVLFLSFVAGLQG